MQDFPHDWYLYSKRHLKPAMESIRNRPDDWAHEVSQNYYAFVVRVAARIAPAPHLTEDIAQQSIMEFLRHWDRWDEAEDPRPLLAKITRITATRFWRQWTRAQPEAVRHLAERIRQRTALLPEEDLGDRRDEMLRHCLDQLSTKARSLVEQYYLHQETTEQLATTYCTQTKNIHQRIFRIREKLKKCVRSLAALR